MRIILDLYLKTIDLYNYYTITLLRKEKFYKWSK